MPEGDLAPLGEHLRAQCRQALQELGELLNCARREEGTTAAFGKGAQQGCISMELAVLQLMGAYGDGSSVAPQALAL
jgi:hypothetical protein